MSGSSQNRIPSLLASSWHTICSSLQFICSLILLFESYLNNKEECILYEWFKSKKNPIATHLCFPKDWLALLAFHFICVYLQEFHKDQMFAH